MDAATQRQSAEVPLQADGRSPVHNLAREEQIGNKWLPATDCTAMNIWRYDAERLKDFDKDALESLYVYVRQTNECIFCSTPLETLLHGLSDIPSVGRDYTYVIGGGEGRRRLEPNLDFEGRCGSQGVEFPVESIIRTCPICGWWTAFREVLRRPRNALVVESFGGVGALKKLDLADVTIPIAAVRSYLSARYEARFAVDPRIFEETVASVFRDCGYSARVTAYSGDDGIDVILDGPGDSVVGVQVKRYRGRIGVAQIRELVGALVVNGLTQGIFVTTSDFQAGSARTVDLAGHAGQRIELYNATRFYDALKIAQRARYKSSDEPDAPYHAASLQHIFQQISPRRTMDFG